MAMTEKLMWKVYAGLLGAATTIVARRANGTMMSAYVTVPPPSGSPDHADG